MKQGPVMPQDLVSGGGDRGVGCGSDMAVEQVELDDAKERIDMLQVDVKQVLESFSLFFSDDSVDSISVMVLPVHASTNAYACRRS